MEIYVRTDIHYQQWQTCSFRNKCMVIIPQQGGDQTADSLASVMLKDRHK